MTAAAVAALLSWAVLLSLLGAIAVADLRTLRIPNRLNGWLFLGGMATAALGGPPALGNALLGAALGGGAMLAVALAFRHRRGVDGLGLGDVKFTAAAGPWIGWIGIGPLILLAATGALLVAGARRLAGHRLDPRAPIALGPYLCIALVLVRLLEAAGLWGLG